MYVPETSQLPFLQWGHHIQEEGFLAVQTQRFAAISVPQGGCVLGNKHVSEWVRHFLSETLLGKQTCYSTFSWQAWTQTREDYLHVLSGWHSLSEIVWCSCLHCSALCLVNKPECSCPLLLPWWSREHTEKGAYSVKVRFYRGKYRRRRGKSPHPPITQHLLSKCPSVGS